MVESATRRLQNQKNLFRCKLKDESFGPYQESSMSTLDNTFIKMRIDIADTGCGISKEGLKLLFMDFGKLQESAGRNSSGTGLGLSFSKLIIN